MSKINVLSWLAAAVVAILFVSPLIVYTYYTDRAFEMYISQGGNK